MLRAADISISKWTDVCTHFNRWFYKPDLDALLTFCCAFAAHDVSSSEPIWPMIVGPPSTGKTEVVIRPFENLRADVFPQGDITPKAFLSGSGNRSGSLLHRIGKSGILLFKDFGTISSKRDLDLKEVLGFLREIYDGGLVREVGGKRIKLWEGKITILAAATEDIERVRLMTSALGERFVYVRWGREDSIEKGKMARRQIGHEKEIRAESQRVIREFLTGAITSVPKPLPEDLSNRIDYLAEMTAWLRGHVIRDRSEGKMQVIDVPMWEGSSRLNKTMSLLASFHAALFGREEAIEADMMPAHRIAFDSVRRNRIRFIDAIPLGADQTYSEVLRLSSISPGSIDWTANDLHALGIISKHDECVVSYRFTEAFEAILRGTGTRPTL